LAQGVRTMGPSISAPVQSRPQRHRLARRHGTGTAWLAKLVSGSMMLTFLKAHRPPAWYFLVEADLGELNIQLKEQGVQASFPIDGASGDKFPNGGKKVNLRDTFLETRGHSVGNSFAHDDHSELVTKREEQAKAKGVCVLHVAVPQRLRHLGGPAPSLLLRHVCSSRCRGRPRATSQAADDVQEAPRELPSAHAQEVHPHSGCLRRHVHQHHHLLLVVCDAALRLGSEREFYPEAAWPLVQCGHLCGGGPKALLGHWPRPNRAVGQGTWWEGTWHSQKSKKRVFACAYPCSGNHKDC